MINSTERIRAEAPVSVYESMYDTESAYDLPYRKSHYYPLFRVTLKEVLRLGGQSVLEVGSGSGSFAQLLFDTSNLSYTGFDFAQSAVEKAKRRTGREAAFFVGDARNADSYSRNYDTIVCTEVLEHVERDLQVISQWRPGCKVVCSVPNFDIPEQHVRFFRHEMEVRARYGKLIDIERVVRIARPIFRGQTIGEYLRKIRWSRNDPKRLFAMLGYKTFDNWAGWFVFSGRRCG